MSRWFSQPNRHFQLIAHSPLILILPFRRLHTKRANWIIDDVSGYFCWPLFCWSFDRKLAGGRVRKRENENVLRWHLKVKSVEIYFRGTACVNKKKREHFVIIIQGCCPDIAPRNSRLTYFTVLNLFSLLMLSTTKVSSLSMKLIDHQRRFFF